MGTLLSILFAFSFAKNFEGFSSVRPQDPKLWPVWSATAKIQNTVERRKDNDLLEGEIQLVRASIDGSGVLVKKISEEKALVVTNAHVATCDTTSRCRLRLTFYIDDEKIMSSSARVVKSVFRKDLALLEIRMSANDLKKISVAKLSPLYSLNSGDKIFAIGYPNLGLRRAADWQSPMLEDTYRVTKRISKGQGIEILSLATSPNYEYIDGRRYHFSVGPVAKHSADTLGGNSGGPIVNEEGEVLAINSGIHFEKGKKHNRYCYQNGTSYLTDLGCSYFAIGSEAVITNLGLEF